MNNISMIDVLVGGTVGMLLQYVVIKFNQYLGSKSKVMHGTWYEVLPKFQGLPERVDKIKLWQEGNLIHGKAWRISPENESKRKWLFSGFISGNKLIGFFYILDNTIDPSSYIPIVMTRDIHVRHESVWRGIYYRPEFESDNNIIEGQLTPGIMWWQRTNPNKKSYKKWLGTKSEQIA